MLGVHTADADHALAFAVSPLEDEAVLAHRFHGGADLHGRRAEGEEEGLLEIKCPSAWQHMSWLVQDGSAHEAYKVQVQCQLLVTERKWVDVLSYYPGLPEALVRVERDEDFISILGPALYTFAYELERQTAILQDRGWISGKRAPAISEQDQLIGALKDSLRELKR